MKQDKQKTRRSKRREKDFTQRSLEDKIGESLRQIYSDVVSEDVPFDFLAILESADREGGAPND